MTEKRGPNWWEGGYRVKTADGRDLFIIQKMIGKRRYKVSTRAHSRRAALEQLDKFEADPDAYVAAMRDRSETDALRLTADLIDEYRQWLTKRIRPAPTTEKHANEMERRLEDWMKDLGPRHDLRRLDLGALKKILRTRRTSEQHRVIALKAFCSWLREEKHILHRRDDVTIDLKVPQGVPEKHRRRKAVDVENIRAVLADLADRALRLGDDGAQLRELRDCLLLMAHTGSHVSELERFARDPDSRVAPGRGAVLGVLQVRHKSGKQTRVPLMKRSVLEAAQRIRSRGTLPRRLNKKLEDACRAAGVEPFTFGVLRHSVATAAIEAGTPAEVVAEFLGHASKETTLAFYADAAVPTAIVKLPDLD